MRRIIIASITAVVVIAVLAGTLIPVLDDATATTDTFTNDGAFRLSYVEPGTENIIIEWNYETPYVFTVNDVDYDVQSTVTEGTNYSVVLGSDWVVRYTAGSKLQGLHTSTGYGGVLASVADSTNMTITLNAGTMTLSNGTDTNSVTYTDGIYYIDPAGQYVMKGYDEDAYVLADSTIYGRGITSLFSANTVTGVVGITGDIDTGVSGGVYWSTDSGYTDWTVSSAVVSADAVDGYVDLYSLSSVTYTVTYSDETTTKDVTYSSFVVPYEVTAEMSVHFTDGENAILNAIPVIVIIALLLGVVAIVLRSRMD